MALSIAPLFSGSSGNSTYIASPTTCLLVDAGLSAKTIEGALCELNLDARKLKGILITHEHSDHIRGIDVLARRYGLNVYANSATWEASERFLSKLPQAQRRVIDRADFVIGDILVTPVPLSHDAADPFGYVFTSGGRKIGIMTDTGRTTEAMLESVRGADIVLLESNHDIDMLRAGRYPYQLKTRILSGHGHLSNADAGKTAVSLASMGVRGILLGHLSGENNFPELAYRTVADALMAAGYFPGKNIALGTARRSGVTGLYEVV